MHASVIVEHEWPFEDNDPEWTWCLENAAFVHKEACEFIIHIGEQGEDDSFFVNTIKVMNEAGLSSEFIQAYTRAAELGARRVLFYS